MIEILIGGVWAEGEPSHGEKYREIKENGSVVISYWGDTQEDTVYSVGNISVTINGNAPATYQPIYFVTDGDTITMSADIVDSEGNVQTQLDQAVLGYPPVLALPLTKYAGGSSGKIIDEVYFQTSLVNGVISTTGTLASKGNWKLKTERINESLKAIGADWGVDSLNVDFIVG